MWRNNFSDSPVRVFPGSFRVAVTLTIILASIAPTVAETWTNLQGTGSIEAKMIGLWEDSVILERADGSRITIPLNKLRGDSRIQARKLARELAAARSKRIGELKQQIAEANAPAPTKRPAPDPAPQYQPPTEDLSIGDFVSQVNAALTSGHLRVLYDARPPSYRKDLAEVIQLAATKTSEKSFQAMISIPDRLGDLIVSRQNWLFDGPRFANVPEQNREKAKWMLLGLGNVLSQGIDPDTMKLETFQSDGFETWLDSWDRQVAPYVAEMIKQADIDLNEYTSVTSEGEGTAVLATGSPEAPTEMEMILVEGFWVPKMLANTWQADVERAKSEIGGLSDGQYMAEQVATASLIRAMIETLAAADSAANFNRALDTVLSQPDSQTALQRSLASILSPIDAIMMGVGEDSAVDAEVGDDTL